MIPSHRFVVVAFMAAVFAWTGFPSSASAQSRGCVDDVQQFCPGVQPAGGRIIQCLKAHETELSAACKDRLQTAQSRGQAARTHAQAIRQACQRDMATLCHDVGSGGGRMLQCLQQHKADLSATCQAALAPAKPGSTPSQ
jgi:Cysteine rich repeat